MSALFKEVPLAGKNQDTAIINLNAVVAFVPMFGKGARDGELLGTDARMIDGTALLLNLSLEQIGDLIS